MSDNNDELNNAQKGFSNCVLTLAFFMFIPIIIFGCFAILSTFVISPELQTMPDQNGYIRPVADKLFLYGAIIIVPFIFLGWVNSKLGGFKK
jgi:hypothetical protein